MGSGPWHVHMSRLPIAHEHADLHIYMYQFNAINSADPDDTSAQIDQDRCAPHDGECGAVRRTERRECAFRSGRGSITQREGTHQVAELPTPIA
jgi:hypothetical protein